MFNIISSRLALFEDSVCVYVKVEVFHLFSFILDTCGVLDFGLL